MALVKCDESGKSISENAVRCPNCGARNKYNDERTSFGLKVVCFFITIIGIIIFATNISTRPKYAKDCLFASLLPLFIVLEYILLSVLRIIFFGKYNIREFILSFFLSCNNTLSQLPQSPYNYFYVISCILHLQN